MSRPEPNHVHVAKILEWHDGDTVKLDLDLDYETHNNGWHRLIGIDTPELWTPEGKDVHEFVDRYAPPGTEVVIVSYKAKNQFPIGGAKEKFGRWLAEIWLVDEDPEAMSINRLLLVTDRAKVYNGGPR